MKKPLILVLVTVIGLNAFAQKKNKNNSPATAPIVATAQEPTVAPKFNAANVGRAAGPYAIKVKLKGFKNVPIYLADNFGYIYWLS
jgi:hypothetical protein